MEGILGNQAEIFLQFFRPLGNKIIIFLFLKKRNGLKGEYEGQHHCLPTLQPPRGEKYSLWAVTRLGDLIVTSTLRLRRKFFPFHWEAKGMAMQFAKYLYLFDPLFHNEVPVSNTILLYVLSNDCSAVLGHVIYNSSIIRCYSDWRCVILHVCASLFPEKVTFQVLKAEYHWYR